MLGRAVFVLCLLTKIADACPRRQLATNDDAKGIAVALIFMGICGLGFAVTRRNAVRRTFATSRLMTDVDPELFRFVLRAQRRRAAMFCGVWLLALITTPIWADVWQFREEGVVVWTLTTVTFFAYGVVVFSRLHALLVDTDAGGVRVMAHGNHLFAARDGRLVGWVAAPPALLARATSFPTAKLRS